MRYNNLQKKVFQLDAEITRHSNDVIMKAMAETFKDKTLKIFGLNTARIAGVIPTVLPVPSSIPVASKKPPNLSREALSPTMSPTFT